MIAAEPARAPHDGPPSAALPPVHWVFDLGYVLFTVALFRQAFFDGMVFVGRDLFQYFHPLYAAVHDGWTGTGSFLWDSTIDHGLPLFARYTATIAYPTTLLHALFPPERVMTVAILVHLPVAAAAVLRIALRYARDVPASWVAGLGYAFGGYLITMIGGGFYLFGAALLPVSVLAVIRLAERPGMGRAVQCAAVFALQLFAADPQTLFYEAIVLFPVVLAAHAPGPRTIGKAAGWILAAGALACGLAAAQLLPLAEFVGHSTRAGGTPLADLQLWSFHPLRLAEMAVPYLYGGFTPESTFWLKSMLNAPAGSPWAQGVHVGTLTLVCCLAAPALADRDARRSLALWGGATFLFVLLAFGVWFPLHRIAVEALPLADRFRFPEKFLVFVSLGTSLVGAAGLGPLFRSLRTPFPGDLAPRAVLAALGTLALAEAAARLTFAPEWPRRFQWFGGLLNDLGSPVEPAAALTATAGALERAFVVVVVLAALLLLRRRLQPVLLIPLLVAAHATDIGTAGAQLPVLADAELVRRVPLICAALPRTDQGLRPHIWRRDTLLQDRFGRSAVRDALGERRLQADSLFPNIAAAHCASYVHGYETLRLRQYAALEERLLRAGDAVRYVEVLGVNYLIAAPDEFDVRLFPVAARVEELGVVVHKGHGLPYAYGTGRIVAAADGDDAIGKVTGPAFVPSGEVVIEGVGAVDLGEARRDVRAVTRRPGQIEARVWFEKPGCLVVLESFYPGWRAAVDGRETPVRRANAAFVGIDVPAGEHVAAFTFDPPIQHTANRASAAALAVAAILALVALVTRGRP